MTRAEWDALTPRERDAIVAEKVMGWVKRAMFLAEHNYGKDLPDRGDPVWADPNEPKRYHYLVEDHEPECEDDQFEPGFSPTTSWDAMREVVENLQAQRGLSVNITVYWSGTAWASLMENVEVIGDARANTAPEAVCIAALTALGEMEP